MELRLASYSLKFMQKSTGKSPSLASENSDIAIRMMRLPSTQPTF